MQFENGFLHDIVTQGHCRSFILQRISWVAYHRVVQIVLSVTLRLTTPVQFDAPAQGNPGVNLHTPYIFGNQTHWATFLLLALWVYFVSFVASQMCELAPNSVTICIYSSSRSSKVIDFGTNGKRIYDFLLVRNSKGIGCEPVVKVA